MLPHEDLIFTRVATYVTLFGGALALLMTLEQLNQKTRTIHNYRFSAMCFFTGMFLLQTGLDLKGFIPVYPWPWFYFTVIFMVGPINVWHDASYTQSDYSFNKLQLLPGLFGFLLDLNHLLRGSGHPGSFLDGIMGEPGLTLTKMPFVLAGTHVAACYVSGVVRMMSDIGGDRELLKKIYFLPLIQLVTLCSTLSMLIGLVLCNRALVAGGTAFISFNVILVMLCYSQVQEGYQTAGNQIKASKYKRSLLVGMETDLIRNRLTDLMMGERLYEEMELNIKRVAARLLMTPQQLSQFLNEEMGMNYRNFVNHYRIEEAKRQLLVEKDKNILNICFDVGFSSKSAFYAAFKRETGTSPSQFRADGNREMSLLEERSCIFVEARGFAQR